MVESQEIKKIEKYDKVNEKKWKKIKNRTISIISAVYILKDWFIC